MSIRTCLGFSLPVAVVFTMVLGPPSPREVGGLTAVYEGGPSASPRTQEAVRGVLDPELSPRRGAGVVEGSSFQRAEAPFALSVRGDPVPFAVFFQVALPGERIRLEADPMGEPFSLVYSAGSAQASDGVGWIWEAPTRPGSYALKLTRGPASEIWLNVFVLRPYPGPGSGPLNGYRIGNYETRPLRGDSIYLPPPGFIQVPPSDQDILVSPHFTIGQFLCKQEGNPRYLALSRYLVAKLEVILDAVNAEGYPALTLHVMSGFRTPWYNRAIGNRTVFSRHLWGGAADVFLDADGDGTMDDLNGDGQATIADARVLMAIAESVDVAGRPGTRPGGLSAYRRNEAHGPFIHVDARGTSARW